MTRNRYQPAAWPDAHPDGEPHSCPQCDGDGEVCRRCGHPLTRCHHRREGRMIECPTCHDDGPD